MKQRIRALGRKLELATYANDQVSEFKLSGEALSSEQLAVTVAVPVPIMYRYYHVGRAYDLHQLKNMQPTGKSSFDFTSIQLLIQELEQVTELINDPVLQHYSNLLVPLLEAVRSDTKARLLCSNL